MNPEGADGDEADREGADLEEANREEASRAELNLDEARLIHDLGATWKVAGGPTVTRSGPAVRCG